MATRDPNVIRRVLVCGHGDDVLGADDASLSSVWCPECREMVGWARGEWSLGYGRAL